MPITAATVKVGEAIWRAIAPWKRLKQARNKRRARLGKPLLKITEEDETMLPKGTMTHTGTGIAAAGPIVAMVLTGIGIGECTPEAADMGCVGASQIAGALVTLVGAVLAIVGKVRASARERQLKADLAAAAQSKPAA